MSIGRERVGFVGLGMMGFPMASNILKAGHQLVAYDVDNEKNGRIAALGATIGAGPADIARQCAEASWAEAEAGLHFQYDG